MCGVACIGAIVGGALGARFPLGMGASEGDLPRRPTGRGSSLGFLSSE